MSSIGIPMPDDDALPFLDYQRIADRIRIP